MNVTETEIVVSEKGQEIVVAEQMEQALAPTHNFELVNLEDINSILNYGASTLQKIGDLFDSTANLASAHTENPLSKELIGSISGFSDTLDDKETQKGLVVCAKSMLGKIGIKKFQEEPMDHSYQAQYAEYCRNISEVCEALFGQLNDTFSNMELRAEIAAELQPLLDELEEEIKFGEAARQTRITENNVLRAKRKRRYKYFYW